MPRNFASFRAALAAAGVLLASTPAPAAAAEGPCPPERPVLSVPAVVNRFESYSISWTNVLATRPTGPADIFVVERSEDPTFAQGVERFQTKATSNAYGAPLGVPRTLYHRVAVQSFCCRADRPPRRVEGPSRRDHRPVHSAHRGRASGHQPGGASGLHDVRRLLGHADRRSAGTGRGRPGPPLPPQAHVELRRRERDAHRHRNGRVRGRTGEYLYQLRTENVCGDVSEWSRPGRAIVGTSKTSALALVSAPKPFLVPDTPGAVASTKLVVRNAGSESLEVTASSPGGALLALPERFPGRVG